MKTGLQRRHDAGVALSSAWTISTNVATVDCGNPMLDQIDYSNVDAVEMARAAILGMRIWDDIADRAFKKGEAQAARQAMAHVILCRKAAVWRANHVGHDSAPGFGLDNLRAAQAHLFAVLSPEGMQAITEEHEVGPGGILYMPRTGNAELDDLIRMVVDENVIRMLRDLSNGSCEAADILQAHAEAWRNRAPIREEAKRLEGEGWLAAHTGDFYTAAIAMEKSAIAWAYADDSQCAAARALSIAASHWIRVREVDRAALVDKKAAKIWNASGQPDDAAKSYGRAAVSLYYAGQHAAAAMSHARAALAWEDANQLPSAATAWTYAGMPERSARAWRDALHDAGENTPRATQIINRAATLFHTALDFEETRLG